MALIDKASLLMVPSTYEAGKLYNVLPSGNRAPDSTDQNSGYDQTRADFDFDRGTDHAATRIGSDGLIKKYRENLYTESNNFSDSDWSPKAGVFTKGVLDPNGGNEAWSWKAQNTDPFLYQAKNFTGVHCLSIYVKGVGSTIGEDFEIRVGTNLKDVTLTGEWQRVQHFGVLSGSVNIGFEYGNPATPNDVVHIYAAQLETGLVATDVLTSGATTAKAGVLVDLPRINYDANGENGSLLLEPSRTNRLPHSEYMGSYPTEGVVTIEHNSAISPEGVQNATNLIAPATYSRHHLYDQNIPISSNATAVIYAKPNGHDYLAMSFINGSNSQGCGVIIDLTDGSLFSNFKNSEASFTHNVSDAANGFKRVEFILSTTGVGVNYFSWGSCVSSFGWNVFTKMPNFSGDGTSGILIYGVQVEMGASYPSSYIPTMGTAQTRAADSCSVTGVSDVIGQSEGTMYVEGNALANDLSYRSIGLNSGSATNRLLITFNNVSNNINFLVQVGSITQVNMNYTNATITDKMKIAFAYKANDFVAYVNGTQVATDTSGSTYGAGVLTDVTFDNAAGADKMVADLKNLTLFKERLTNAELATLTTL